MNHLHHDIVFVSLEDWDMVWRRNQFLAAGLARRYPHIKILFVGLPANMSHCFRRFNFSSLRHAFQQSTGLVSPEGLPNIHILKPAKWFPKSIPAGRETNEAVERAAIRTACAKLGIKDPLLWINDHRAGHLVGTLNEAGVVYDITDDWISCEQSARERALVSEQDAFLLRNANTVIVCSERLMNIKAEWSSNIQLIPNGVAPEKYRLVAAQQPAHPDYAAAERLLPLPDATKTWHHPVLAYTGSVHSERIDVTLLCEVARRIPQATVAVIGPSYLDREDTARLESQPNIRMVGAVPYDEIPRWVRACDVMIVPHHLTRFTESLNPIKLYEYLASGLPVVTTPVPGFRENSELFYLATDADGMVKGIQEALTEHPEMRARRQAASLEHSWEARLDHVARILQMLEVQSGDRTSVLA